jgi:hypothetical protein
MPVIWPNTLALLLASATLAVAPRAWSGGGALSSPADPVGE